MCGVRGWTLKLSAHRNDLDISAQAARRSSLPLALGPVRGGAATTTTTATQTNDVAMRLLDVGEDGLESIMLQGVKDAFTLAKLAMTCTNFNTMLTDTALLRRLAHSRGFVTRDEDEAKEDKESGRDSDKNSSEDEMDSDDETMQISEVARRQAAQAYDAIDPLGLRPEVGAKLQAVVTKQQRQQERSRRRLDECARPAGFSPRLGQGVTWQGKEVGASAASRHWRGRLTCMRARARTRTRTRTTRGCARSHPPQEGLQKSFSVCL